MYGFQISLIHIYWQRDDKVLENVNFRIYFVKTDYVYVYV